MIDLKHKQEITSLLKQEITPRRRAERWETIKAFIALAVFLGAMTAVHHIDKL